MNRYVLYTGPTTVQVVAARIRRMPLMIVTVEGTESVIFETEMDYAEVITVLRDNLYYVRASDVRSLPA